MIDQRVVRLWILLVAVVSSAFACSSPDPNAEYKFLCTMPKNGWQLCNQNRVRYCHIDHFHTGQNCEQHKLECVETSEKEAVCVDKSKSCKDKESKCEKNIAYNCISGSFSVEPCGTAKNCESKDGKAFCKSKVVECSGKGELHDGKCECNDGYKVDPDDERNCIPK